MLDLQQVGYIDPSPIQTVGPAVGWIVALVASFFGTFLFFIKRFLRFAKKHKRWTIGILTVILIGSAGSGFMFFFKKPTKQTETRIIVIGLDGLSPVILERLMAEGRLPNFQRLQAQGSFRPLSTTNPPQSPVAWSGFATGQNPGKHGVYDFIRRDPADYSIDLSLTRQEHGHSVPVRDGRAFWQYCSDRQVPVTILNCPVTYPPDRVHGKMLSGMGVPDLLGTQGTFSFYTTEEHAETGDVAGQILRIERAPTIPIELLGPNQSTMSGEVKRLVVPAELTVTTTGAQLKLPDTTLALKVGEWSRWQSIKFKTGPLQSLHGIVQFLLVESEPEIKLYVSPISMDPRRPQEPISHPSDYSDALVDDLGSFATRGMPFDTWPLNEGRIDDLAFLSHARTLLDEKTKLMELELARFESGVFFCYYEYPDIMQHMFWRYQDPQNPLYDADASADWKGMVDQVYVEMDAVVGKVMAQARPTDLVVVLSDHGFTDFRRVAHINSWLRQQGYLSLYDPMRSEGRPLLQDVDFSRTRAYAVGFGGIYLNRVGREAEGIVAEDQVAALRAEIAGKLADWRDPESNEPIAHRIYLQEEAFHGPHASKTPDLFIGFNHGYTASWQTALGGVPSSEVEDNLKKWSGTHLVDPTLVPGILFTNRPLSTDTPSILDIAPTILKEIGYSDDELRQLELDGRALEWAP